ncbi:MAG TPA: hypothetical protein VIW68_01090 [Candidatus Sulfotelmatobacter sp.]
MSISSIASHNNIASGFSVGSPSARQTAALNQLRQQFQQLGQDLQSGSLSAAQSDFATLQQEASLTAASPTTLGKDPITQALNQLRTQLQSGDLAGPQPRPVANVPIAQPSPAPGTHHHGHHHPSTQGPADPAEPEAEGFDQLGQALQSNNLSAAQQAYNSVLQSLPLSLRNGVLSTPDVLSQSAVSLTA